MRRMQMLHAMAWMVAAASLAACTARDGRKMLAAVSGGDDGSGGRMEQRAAAGDEGSRSGGDVIGLELPAPLAGCSEQILRRDGYTVSYNGGTRLPNWVAWHLTAAHVTGRHKRGGIRFQEDEEVAAPRATDADYRRSGFDRGHMCPSGDNKWSKTAQRQSFLLTNVCPQSHNLNAGDWNEMEAQCRRWAEETGGIYIVCGPILYDCRHKTIGKSKVVVPEAFFKVVLCMRGEPRAIGFIYKNTAGNRPKGDYVNSVDEVERITDIDFFPALPDEVETKIEAETDIDSWM